MVINGNNFQVKGTHGIYSYQFNPTQSQEKSVSNQLDKPHESFAF